MKKSLRTLAGVGALGLAAGLFPMAAAHAAASSTGAAARNVAVCPTPQDTLSARCYAVLHERLTADGKPAPAASSPAGYGPSSLQAAYALATYSGANGGGSTVALVDAYDDPYAASDLNTYRSKFGLPAVSTCTISSGKVQSPGGPCFLKVNQNGVAGSYPGGNGGWAQEESLDVDMVSAICPNCNIVLVEASTASFSNLGTAVNTAAKLGATAISNSYGSSGDASDSTYGGYYNHPGIAVTASTGDNGYGVGYPATSDYTVAAGGTSLTGSGTSWTETAWSGAGSGCSTYQSEPTWQQANGIVTAACGGKRGIADVSADADPNTGVAVYDSYSYQGYSGWLEFGGTSVASPIIASVYALAGVTTSYPASLPYAATSGLYDVTSGSNGSCSTAVLCNAGTGWDGPTGLGSPRGLGAFGGTSSGGGGGGTTTVAAPTNLTASGGTSSVSLSWTASSTSGVTYTVYRSTTSGGELSTPAVASGLSGTSYTDSSLASGTYYYEVTASTTSATSSPSNQASATVGTTPLMGATVSYSHPKNALNITVHVSNDSTSAAISNASVTISVYDGTTFVGSATNTTNSNGDAGFRVRNPQPGTYSTTINTLTASGYQWDGIQPSNTITI